MTGTLPRRLISLVLAVCSAVTAVLALSVGTATAHNTLVSSDPADGATLTEAPTQVVWTFDQSVPLETMTVTLIDASGVRQELTGSTHGATEAEVVTPLPSLEPGTVSIRWRLVSPDGHPISGRIGLTIEAAAATTTEPPPSDTAPTTLAPVTTVDDGGDGSFSTPSAVRWVLRYGSYLAIMAVVGILLTDAYVWGGADGHPLLRRILSWSLVTVAALGFLQALVIASDITGDPPWRSVGALDAATSTTAGMALMIRVVLAGAMWLIVFRYRTAHADVYGSAVRLLGLALLGTWAFAGHAGSMRWPELGVITDVAHHAAAALWIAGLAIVGWIVIPSSDDGVIVTTVRRFSSVAAICVGVLVVTGLFQSWRLVGNPGDLFAADHGRYLAVKLAALAGMLVFADRNRRRVRRTLDAGHLERHVGALRRGVVTEFAIGLVIIAITAVMVVSPPATSEVAATGPATTPPVYYTP